MKPRYEPHNMLWIGADEPTRAQINELSSVFGDVLHIVNFPQNVYSAQDVMNVLRAKRNIDEVVVSVLDHSVIAEMLRTGIKPIVFEDGEFYRLTMYGKAPIWREKKK